jgi:hypothetical protein
MMELVSRWSIPLPYFVNRPFCPPEGASGLPKSRTPHFFWPDGPLPALRIMSRRAARRPRTPGRRCSPPAGQIPSPPPRPLSSRPRNRGGPTRGALGRYWSKSSSELRRRGPRTAPREPGGCGECPWTLSVRGRRIPTARPQMRTKKASPPPTRGAVSGPTSALPAHLFSFLSRPATTPRDSCSAPYSWTTRFDQRSS